LHIITSKSTAPQSHECKKTRHTSFAIAGFRREIAEKCVLLGYYTASSGNFLPKFRYNLSVPSSGVKNPILLNAPGFLSPKDGTDRLPRNARKNTPLFASLLQLQVRIPPRAWMSVSFECCVLSGRTILSRADHSSRGSSTPCDVPEFDREASIMRKP
jgi:hypothetical protein